MSIIPMTYISCYDEAISDNKLYEDKSTYTRYDICLSICLS